MRSSQWLSTAANVVLALSAATVTALVVRRELFPPSPGREAAQETTTVADWRAYAATGHRLGPQGAPVSIVVFSDFQCPACRMLAGYLKAIRAEYPEEVAVIHRHSPLPSHPFAVAAARASECAARQDRFEAFHDALFEDQQAIGFAPWTRFAATAGVQDAPAFEACLGAPGPVPQLDLDTLAARELRVAATPTFLINGVQYRGTPPLDVLRAQVRRAVEAAAAGQRAGAAAALSR